MQNISINQQIADEAADWAIRVDGGTLVLDDREALAKWLRVSPVHVDEFLLAVSLLSGLETIGPKGTRSVDDLLDSLSNDVIALPNQSRQDPENDNAPDSVSRKFTWKYGLFGLTGALICAVVSVAWWPVAGDSSGQPRGIVQADISGEVYTTDIGEQRSIVLEDGSLVHVNTQSKVAIRLSEQVRIVELLEGEALFEVAHDPARPFRVIAGDTVTEAIGTKFNVHRTATGVKVVVVEGKVAVENEKNALNNPETQSASSAARMTDGRLLLAAGEKISFVPNASPQIISGSNVAAETSWRSRQLTFESDNLQTIVNEFNRYNRIQISISDPGLANTQFSGIFDADDPESLVEFLEFTGTVSVDNSTPNKIRLQSRKN